MTLRDRPMALVATREVVEGTRTRSFRVTLAISALAVAAIIVIANLSGGDSDTPGIVVAGADQGRVGTIREMVAASGIEADVTAAADDAAARAAVRDGDADIAVSADGTRLTTDEPVELGGDVERGLAVLLNVLRANLALDNGLQAAGLSPQEAADVRRAPPPELDSIRTAEPADIDSSRIATATVTNILLFIMLQTYGQWVLTGVTREKASRVVEVLLSVITPRQLLVGKIVGIGTLALVHALVLIATAFVTSRIMNANITAGLSPGDLVLAVVWFLLGYGLYCGVYAAAGSLVGRVEDAQSAAFPVMLPLLLGYIVSFSAIEGASTLLWVLAFFPPTAVMTMPTLYALGEAAVWMVAVSMALTLAAVALAAMFAARIYERSVLHSGKKLSWKEAFRRPAEIGGASLANEPA